MNDRSDLGKPKTPEEQEKDGEVRFCIIRNDGKKSSWILLTSLKNLFQKQLPRMPKEYITRLVFDRKHESLVLTKEKNIIVGGVAMKIFKEDRFVEIVFCAITSSEQVRGYGSFMMNYLKEYVKHEYKVDYLLTYADNYAIGYFKKQGFSRTISLDKKHWAGKIKDYDGGTLMECKLIRRVDYRNVSIMLQTQKEAIYKKIKQLSRSHIIYSGIKKEVEKPEDIPGLIEAGWNDSMKKEKSKVVKPKIYEFLRPLLIEMQNHASSWPFLEPVDTEDVKDYLLVIEHPMDLQTMSAKLENNEYRSVEGFSEDIHLIINNCKLYNSEHTQYYKCANVLEKYYRKRLKERLMSKKIEFDV